jgi:hypothetical protein
VSFDTTLSDSLIQAVMVASSENNFAVEFAILGTRDPRAIAEACIAATQRAFESAPARVLFYKVSVGMVAGFTLSDDRSIVLKAHQADRSTESLVAQRSVQKLASAAGINSPQPLVGPLSFGAGNVTFDSYVSSGRAVNTVALPAEAPTTWNTIRRLLAETLIALSRLSSSTNTSPNAQSATASPTATATDIATTATNADIPVLTQRSLLAPNSIYPIPHSPIFDFTLTAPGAEWIDEIATRALTTIRAIEAVESQPTITTHCDLRAENVHLSEDGFTLAAIWDWDSIETATEAWHVGTSARAFSIDFSRDNNMCTDIGIPTVKEMLAFISDCETARGHAYTTNEYQATIGWMHHALAYSARCEHALARTELGVRWTPTFTDRLRELEAANLLS